MKWPLLSDRINNVIGRLWIGEYGHNKLYYVYAVDVLLFALLDCDCRLCSPPLFLALVFIFTPNLKKNHRKLARFFIKIIAKALKLRVLIDGIANIPTNQPCIFMANHSSLIDILVYDHCNSLPF